MDKPNIFPTLRYRDGKAALDWLAKAFGFEKLMVVPGKDGHVAHAEMKLGAGVVMLGSGPHDPPGPWDSERQGIYVAVTNVDAHYARAKAAGADIVMELRDTDYGSREYSVRDLDGHLWAFGTYLPK